MFSFPFPELQALGEALGWTFFHTLWFGSVIGILVRLYVKRTSNKEPQRQYAALVLGQFVMFLGACVTFLLYWVSASSISAEIGASVAYSEGWEYVVGQDSQEFFSTLVGYLNAQAPWLALIWFIGVIALTIRWFGGWSYLQWLKGQAMPLEDSAILRQLDRISKRFALV